MARRPTLPDSVPGLVFTVFLVAAGWAGYASREVWWLSVALVVLGIGSGAAAAIITWRKLPRWPADSLE